MGNSGLIKIIDTYLCGCNNEVRYYGNVNMRYATIQGYLANLTEFECPDGYSIVGNSVCIIEHFEFDSTKATSDGSKSRMELNRIEKSFSKIEPPKGGVMFQHDSLNVHHNSKHYIDNALRNFSNHYSKIDLYIENLSKRGILHENYDVEVGFFIEDTTLLGNIYCPPENCDSLEPVVLAHCNQFLDIFESSSRYSAAPGHPNRLS